jgi:predicted MFS family arabinose efflux permease
MTMWQFRGQQSWRVVVALAVGAFVTILNLTLLSPLLTAISATFHVSEAAAGQLGTATSVVATLVAFGATSLMDRLDHRTWLRLQAGVLLVATLISALAPSFPWLIAGRLLAGAGSAVVLANCLAIAADAFPDQAARDRAVGLIVSATTIAVLAGLPVVAQISAFASWRWAIASLTIPLVVLLAGSRLLPRQDRPRSDPGHEPAGYRVILGHRPTFNLLARLLLFGLVYVGWLTYFGAYVEQDFGKGANTLSALFLVAGVAELVANNLAPWLLHRVAARNLIVTLTGVFTLPLVLANFTVFAHLWGLFLTASLVSAAAAMLYIICNALLLDARPEARGRVMALASAFGGCGAALGALVGGLMLDLLGSYAAMYRTLGLLLPLGVLVLELVLVPGQRTTAAHPLRVPGDDAAQHR